MEKLEQLKKLLKSGKTFTGLDLEMDDYNSVNVKNNHTLFNGEDLFEQFLSKYSARGVYLENATQEEYNLLHDVFGEFCIPKKNSSTNDLSILTHIDKKGIIERTIEGAFNVPGGALCIPAGLAIMVGEQIGNKGPAAIPLLVLSAGAVIPVAVVGTAGLLAGTGLASIPKLYDKVKDWTNGDEREFACNVAERIMTKQTNTKDLDIMKTLESMRENNNKNDNKNRM
jgi:hypothetical protein